MVSLYSSLCDKANERVNLSLSPSCSLNVGMPDSAIPTKDNEDINNMKFSAVVGNPPYQMTVAKKDTENGQKAVINIFHYFTSIFNK